MREGDQAQGGKRGGVKCIEQGGGGCAMWQQTLDILFVALAEDKCQRVGLECEGRLMSQFSIPCSAWGAVPPVARV